MKSQEQIQAAIDNLERVAKLTDDDTICATVVALAWVMEDPICAEGFETILATTDAVMRQLDKLKSRMSDADLQALIQAMKMTLEGGPPQ